MQEIIIIIIIIIIFLDLSSISLISDFQKSPQRRHKSSKFGDDDDDDFYTYLWIYKVKLRSTSIQGSVKIPEVSKLGTQNTGNVGLQNDHKFDLTTSAMQNKRNSLPKVYWPVASSNFQVPPALCSKCQ